MVKGIPLLLVFSHVEAMLALNPPSEPSRPELRTATTKLLSVAPPQLSVQPVPQAVGRQMRLGIGRIENQGKVDEDKPDDESPKEQGPRIPAEAESMSFVQEPSSEFLLVVELLRLGHLRKNRRPLLPRSVGIRKDIERGLGEVVGIGWFRHAKDAVFYVRPEAGFYRRVVPVSWDGNLAGSRKLVGIRGHFTAGSWRLGRIDL